MKKGLIELRTGRKYTPGLPKEECADEIVDTGFDVDYESFENVDEVVDEGFDVDYESFKEGEHGKNAE